jgi:hypothetical protein
MQAATLGRPCNILFGSGLAGLGEAKNICLREMQGPFMNFPCGMKLSC